MLLPLLKDLNKFLGAINKVLDTTTVVVEICISSETKFGDITFGVSERNNKCVVFNVLRMNGNSKDGEVESNIRKELHSLGS